MGAICARRPSVQKFTVVEQFDSFDCLKLAKRSNGYRIRSSELERLQIHCNHSQFLLTEVVVIDNILFTTQLSIIGNLYHSNIREIWMKKFGMLSQLTLS